MVKPSPLLTFCTVLVACGTPQQQCINRETRDLRVVDRLIVEAEGNLKRGYAYEDVVISRTVLVTYPPLPVPPPVDGAPPPEPAKPRISLEDRDETITRPVAIDLAAEQSKLSGLKTKHIELAAAGVRSITACRNAYPE